MVGSGVGTGLVFLGLYLRGKAGPMAPLLRPRLLSAGVFAALGLGLAWASDARAFLEVRPALDQAALPLWAVGVALWAIFLGRRGGGQAWLWVLITQLMAGGLGAAFIFH